VTWQHLASTHGETRCLSAGDVLEEEEDSKNSTDNRSDDREDILEEGIDDDMVDEEGIDLVEVDYLVFHKYEEDVSGNQDDLGDVDEDTEDDHEDGVDQEARQMTISDIDS